jgi:hypothetical protein
MSGLEHVPTESLVVVRANLLKGLDKVADHVDNGTVMVAKDEKSVPPLVAGQMTYMMLGILDAELVSRGVESVL